MGKCKGDPFPRPALLGGSDSVIGFEAFSKDGVDLRHHQVVGMCVLYVGLHIYKTDDRGKAGDHSEWGE